VEQFCSYYKGSRKLRWERAMASLVAAPVEWKDSISRPFVKGETFDMEAKPDPAPRIISPRDPRYGAAVGVWIKPLEHRLYRAISEAWGAPDEPDPTVMKGYNATQVAAILRTKFDRYTHTAVIGLDASRFDQHVSVGALEWEHSVYLQSVPASERAELARLLKWQLHNMGIMYLPEGIVRYKVDGTRLSGDMNTALGNCLLMCAMVWAYAQHVGVRCSLANNGDDCSVFMDGADAARFRSGLTQYFLEMGFTMKVEPTVYEFEQLEFCQTKPVYTPTGWVMTRSPFVGSAKDSICKKPQVSNLVKGTSKWAAAVGEAGLSLCGGIPVFQEQYLYMLRHAPVPKRVQGFGDMESGFEYMAKGMRRRVTEISPATRASFWLAWGVTPDQQLAIESAYKRAVPPREFITMKSPHDFTPICRY
jgi:hypothetical protein